VPGGQVAIVGERNAGAFRAPRIHDPFQFLSVGERILIDGYALGMLAKAKALHDRADPPPEAVDDRQSTTTRFVVGKTLLHDHQML
jgi:hypothetical protein